MSCRKIIVMLTAILLISVPAGYSFGRDFPKRGPKAKELKQRLITLRNWELMEEFGLSGDKAQRVFSILSRFDDQREKLIIERRRLIFELNQALDTGDRPDAELEDLMRRINRCNVELARIPQRELEALKEVFNTRELARYFLFSQRFARQARRLIGRPGNRKAPGMRP